MTWAAVLSVLKAVASGVLDFAKTWIGGVTIASVLVWGWTSAHDHKACRQKIDIFAQEMKAKSAAEIDRRESVLLQTRAEAQKDADAMTTQMDKLRAQLKAVEDASHADDIHSCLPASGVRRLNKL